MALFYNIAFKLFPLYINIILGYIAGKRLDVNRDSVATIMFYIINPLIILNGVIHTKLDPTLLTLPLLTFLLGSSLCLLFYSFSRKIWADTSKNIMAFSAGSGNTGYFGLPLAMLIFDSQTQGIYILAILGITLYENSIGYYITAKGTSTASECFSELIRLPTVYAFLLGILINYSQIPIPTVFHEFISHIRGVYAVLGMMIVGIALAGLTNFKLDFKFIGMTFIAKFLVWPLLILTLIEIDLKYFDFYEHPIHQALILLSIVPLGVNTVVMASLIKAQPEKAATTVLLSILFALFYIPIMTAFFISP